MSNTDYNKKANDIFTTIRKIGVDIGKLRLGTTDESVVFGFRDRIKSAIESLKTVIDKKLEEGLLLKLLKYTKVVLEDAIIKMPNINIIIGEDEKFIQRLIDEQIIEKNEKMQSIIRSKNNSNRIRNNIVLNANSNRNRLKRSLSMNNTNRFKNKNKTNQTSRISRFKKWTSRRTSNLRNRFTRKANSGLYANVTNATNATNANATNANANNANMLSLNSNVKLYPNYKTLYDKIDTLSEKDSKTFVSITRKMIGRLNKENPDHIKQVLMIISALLTKMNEIMGITEEIVLDGVTINPGVKKQVIEKWKEYLKEGNGNVRTLEELRNVLKEIFTSLTQPMVTENVQGTSF